MLGFARKMAGITGRITPEHRPDNEIASEYGQERIEMRANISLFLKSKNFIKMALFIFICSSASAVCSPFISLFLAQSINATPRQIGFFISMNSFSALIISTAIAYLSDKIGKRRLLLGIALFSGVIGYLFYSFIRNYFILLMVSVFLIGISTTTTTQLFAYAKELFHNDNMVGTKIATLRTFMSVAWVTSPLMGTFLNNKYGFKGLFFGTMAGYSSALLFLTLFFKNGVNNNYEKTPDSSNKKKRGNYNYITIIVYFCIFTFLQIVNTVLNTNIPLYITETLGYSNVYVGIITSFSAFVELPSILILASLSLKIDDGKLIMAGILFGIIFLLLLCFITEIYLIILLHILKSVFVAAYMSLGISFFQNMVPTHYGVSTVLFMNTTRVGSIFSGVVIGLIGNKYIMMFILLIVICLISVFTFLCVYYKKGERHE
jgi:SET family sugar efflux transporter-like MFS transporter